VLPFDNNAVGLCIADVAGKGMPAALLMSNLQAAVRGLASASVPPNVLCARWNQLLCRNIAMDRFITFFYAHLDGSRRELQYVNAGHNAPIVMRRNGSHERLKLGGGVLGLFANQHFDLGNVTLNSGDRLVLFTDGVTEAGNVDGEEFGEDRLIALLQENRAATAKEIQHGILSAAGEFSRHNWTDDATLLILSVA
jgi:phosphoserine phosphatase RsbU/P